MPPEPAQSLPDRSASPAVVYIARCAEHGLHGERDKCFVCGKPVEHVTYVRGDLHLDVASRNGQKLQDLRRLRAENERYREAIKTALDTMAVANDEQMGPGGVARKAYAHLWHEYFAIPAGIKRSVALDEQEASGA